MLKKTWIILGATSIIAESFAQLAAKNGHSLLLVGRDLKQLELIAADIHLRYRVSCECLQTDFYQDLSALLNNITKTTDEIDVFIAFSSMYENDQVDLEKIAELVTVNIQNTIKIIHTYLNKSQGEHRLIFLSSVAACRGRVKNSLYGASKAAVETYLSGIQQKNSPNTFITVARLGFIDTQQTFGKEGIFYASPPQVCAKACWDASFDERRLIYHPFFWRFIMGIIGRLPFFLFKKMGRT